MLKIITDDYVVYEIWECDDNGMPYAFVDHFDSLFETLCYKKAFQNGFNFFCFHTFGG